MDTAMAYGVYLFMLVSIVQGFVLASCPLGFEEHMGSCYFFSHGKASWTGAYDTCKMYDAMLVEVNDASENSYLNNKIANLTGSYWIGLTDKLIEGEYVWVTSKTMLRQGDYTNWGPGEPGGQDHENCVFYAESKNWTWADLPCTSAEPYICELMSNGATEILG